MFDVTSFSSDEFLDAQVSCRHLIDISPDAVLIHHLDRIVLVNDECQRLFGANERDQLLGMSPLSLVLPDVISPEQIAPTEERQQQVLHADRTLPLAKATVRCLDGSLVPVETLSIPVPRADGSAAVLVVLRDISERTRAAERLVRSENQVRNILNTAMDGIISMDSQQNIVLFNAAAEAIFGWSAEQVLGRQIDCLIPDRFRSQHRDQVEQFGRGAVQNRRMGPQRTIAALRASGEEFQIEASISKTSADGGTLFTVILRDVTEAVLYRRQIEQQSQVLDQVSDAVSVHDLQDRITYWNAAAQCLFGWSAEEILGKNAFEILYRGDPEILSVIRRETAAGRGWAGELTKVVRSGEMIIVEHRRTILRDSNGVITGYLCLDIDITDRKKRERVAHRSQRLESIGTLAEGIAHDLNNVLTPLLMGANLLASGRVSANHQGLLETMVASAHRGADLVKQLLSFAGGIQGQRSPVRMDKLIAEVHGLLEHTFPKSIQIQTRAEGSSPPVVGDATELTQVLMNLCINARDAMPDGGTLAIEASSILLNGGASQMHPDAHAGTYIFVKVADTGCGMSPTVLDRIFDPFFTTKELGKGTGLGLATTQGIVKSHGGFIIVYSEPGRGSTFSIYLPASLTSTTTDSVTTTPTSGSGHGRTVLIVDDEAFILMLASITLTSAGYRVFTASDGSAAITLFEQHHHEISAVLLDIMMPGLDGLQTLDELRKIDPHVIVIACSGLRTAQREADALEHGAKAFLPKPYSDDHVLRTLAVLLKQATN